MLAKKEWRSKAYQLTCNSSSVDITTGSPPTAGTLGGIAGLSVFDTSTNRVVATPQVGASGSISEDDTPVRAGSSGDIAVTVTWNRNGSATGSAAGSYDGTSVSGCSVPVTVDQGGKQRHKHPHSQSSKPHAH